MATELVMKCDVCGEPGDDVKTYAIRQDGHSWEIDLDEKHAKPLLTLVGKGRVTQAGGTSDAAVRSLERRIRNRPPEQGRG